MPGTAALPQVTAPLAAATRSGGRGGEATTRRRLVVMLAAAVGLVLAGVATALVRARIDDGAHRGMSAPLVDNCTLPDAPAPCDGAPITGTVEYRQDDYGALIVRVTLANARPSSEYPVLLNNCGSRDITTCGTILVG